jgi:hypothetical protein
MKMFVVLGIAILLVSSAYAKVDGAIVQSVTPATEGIGSVVTIMNLSDKAISSYEVEIIAHFPNEADQGGSRMQFSPPPNPLIAPHATAAEKECCYNEEPSKVDASVIMVVYADGTAEAEERQGVSSVNQLMENEARNLKTAKVLTDILTASLGDPSPVDSARAGVKNLIGQVDETLTMSELEETYKALMHAPQGQELETLRQQRQMHAGQAAHRASLPKIRRVQ